mmetsp:Transcript_10577/g.16036  ORF Transcript_10577/g.16036 Transcript_10577/m.16036 type:complete len:422 (-) Transcript_10577:54-1319(-)|eukprot:CAMPEP_0194076566 /NCGR_PEP_ID=MMETSP0149-20130528/3350_1 /TAXON_ID=122233 /ORGANISM="Chaetoceros debilis, Strain MM31A-1" /LENGTH=421 /DNA_ID=CAMNT_0038757347 /DNA_START=134 /DNA_END=1399 /DNA_ORIENTATION=-
MFDSNALYSNRPISHRLDRVIRKVFSIFYNFLRPFLSIAILQRLSIVGPAIGLLVITFFAFDPSFGRLISHAGDTFAGLIFSDYGQSFSRHLLEYNHEAVGVGLGGLSDSGITSRAISRLLEDGGDNYADNEVNVYYQYDDAGGDDDGDGQDDDFITDIYYASGEHYKSLVLQAIGIALMWIFALSLVTSIFSGAFVHALADIYAEVEPSSFKSIRIGAKIMFRIYIFQLLISAGRMLSMALIWVVPAFIRDGSWTAAESLTLQYISSFFFFLLDIVMFAIVPAIVVEGRGPVGAFKRSLHLCKSQRCFIFGTFVGFRVVFAMIAMVIVVVADSGFIFGLFPAYVSIIFRALFDMLTMPIGPIFGFVLYMSVRILNENITQVELTHEFGSSLPATEVVDDNGDLTTDYQEVNAKSSIIEIV